jgi:hypothetical protein
MTPETTLEQLDREAKGYKTQIELGNALDKLRSNRDFTKLIDQAYLKDEAIRLVHAKANPNLQSAESQASILRDIDAIGALAAFFSLVSRNADIARIQLRDNEETRADILENGA